MPGFLAIFTNLPYQPAPAHQINLCNLYFRTVAAYIFTRRSKVHEAMAWMPLDWLRSDTPHEANSPPAEIPPGLRIAGTVVRTIFIVALLLVTLRVSMPQSETIWTVYETPGDLIRLALGLAVCIWVVSQLFVVPKDARAYRTWLYLGLAALPFALILVVVV